MSEKREWIVPVQITVDCDVVVEAETESDAYDAADKHEWLEDSRATGEAVNWVVTGAAMAND